MNAQDTKNLKKRYLVWFYKTVKEAVDRIDRKFTQVEVDRGILDDLRKNDQKRSLGLEKFIDDFAQYVEAKEKEGRSLKYESGVLKKEYDFLVYKLKAVEAAIVKELGRKGLEEIKEMYEREMTRRILASTEH